MLSVIGCGNLNRSDDGLGVVVVQRLRERLERHPVPGVRAFDCGTAGMEVMFRARGSDALLIVDAAQLGPETPPGALYEVPGEELARDYEPNFSLHDFRWQHALAAGRRIFKDEFPAEVEVWLVQAQELGLGTELTPPVAAAADDLYQKLLDRVAAYAARAREGVASQLTIKRGSVQIPAALYEAFFAGRDAAVLLEHPAHPGRLVIMPVEQVAGGVLLKLRNAQGDRSLDATEFLRLRGWDDWAESTRPARWDAELGALSVDMPQAQRASHP